VSQSPDTAVGSEKAQTYIQGWRSLSRLMKQDNSFSGHERHNALLNCGNGQFADAEKIANQAEEIFAKAGATDLAEKCQLRAEQFARGEPWHE